MAKINALIRFYFRVNPDEMSDSVWCRSAEEINYVLKYTGVIVPKENE